jgi:hypothetical protein
MWLTAVGGVIGLFAAPEVPFKVFSGALAAYALLRLRMFRARRLREQESSGDHVQTLTRGLTLQRDRVAFIVAMCLGAGAGVVGVLAVPGTAFKVLSGGVAVFALVRVLTVLRRQQ